MCSHKKVWIFSTVSCTNVEQNSKPYMETLIRNRLLQVWFIELQWGMAVVWKTPELLSLKRSPFGWWNDNSTRDISLNDRADIKCDRRELVELISWGHQISLHYVIKVLRGVGGQCHWESTEGTLWGKEETGTVGICIRNNRGSRRLECDGFRLVCGESAFIMN